MIAFARLAFITAMAAGMVACADLGGPTYGPAPVGAAPPAAYYQPAPPVYYQSPPPVYHAPPAPVYYAPAPPVYYPPPAQYRQEPPKPRLSDMQRRALDNCSLLAKKEQRECRATVMSTVRR